MDWQNAGQLLPYHLRTIAPKIARRWSYDTLRLAIVVPDVRIGWFGGVFSTEEAIAVQ